jgi:muconolactone delta-isomerase
MDWLKIKIDYGIIGLFDLKDVNALTIAVERYPVYKYQGGCLF